MRTFQDDYELGKTKEDETLATLRIKIPDLRKDANKFALFDYYNTTTYVELKTRTFAHDKYPTTMVGYNKVQVAESNPDKTYYFAFAFTDGLYWVEYDKDKFGTYEVKQGGRWDRGRPELNQYCYIPIGDLTKL